MTDPNLFMIPGGIGVEQAQELARQIDADKPNADALCLGVFGVDYLAVAVAEAIRSGKPDFERLWQLGMSLPLAHALSDAIHAKRKEAA